MAKTQEKSDYPAWWDWDHEKDGYEVAGAFLRLGKGFTQQGEKAFVILDVDGVERTVWLHHGVLHNIFARELHRRPDKEFVPGERIEIRQLGTRDSGNTGHTYMNYRAEFPDAPASRQEDILGPPPEPPAKPKESPPTEGAPADDDIPFR